eukprot:gene15599-17173_t
MESSFAIQTFNAVLRQPFGSTSPSSNNIDSSLHSVNNDVQHNTGSLGQPTHKTMRSIITLVLGSPNHKTLASQATLVPGSPTHKTFDYQTSFWFLAHQLTKPSKQHSGSWSSDSRNQDKHHQPQSSVTARVQHSTEDNFCNAFVNSSFDVSYSHSRQSPSISRQHYMQHQLISLHHCRISLGFTSPYPRVSRRPT